jgi:serine protease Do
MLTRRRAIPVFIIGLALGLAVSPALSQDQSDRDRDVLRAFSRSIARVAADVKPTVVSIYTTRAIAMQVPRLPFPEGHPFEDLFPNFPKRMPQRPESRNRKVRGLGSGFIIDAAKGLIVTNHHVIDNADEIKVRLTDKREFEAKLVGSDEKSDLAVIKIQAGNLKQVVFGNSDKLQVGEFVVAVGSPFGLRETVTAGIVSAKGRAGLSIEDYEDFIQTDAAINRGNSGGPLVDIDGRVVGVNTAILSRTGGSVGVGFAIPINMARPIVQQLVRHGKVTRGFLGVLIQDVSSEMADRLGLDKAAGALVSQVMPDTPAARAKIQVGDVIVSYDGEPVSGVAKFRNRVAATPPNTKTKLVVLRDGKRKTLTVSIGTLKDGAVATVPGGAPGTTTAKGLGLTVQNLTADLAERLSIKAKSGVVVTAVDPAGPAVDKGISQGDVIIEVDRSSVNNVAEFEAQLKKADADKGVLLLIVNQQGTRFVVLKPDKS